jgi:hypothetical protein
VNWLLNYLQKDYPSHPLSEALLPAWQERAGKIYLADLMIGLGTDPFLTFDLKNGLLLAQTQTMMYSIYSTSE